MCTVHAVQVTVSFVSKAAPSATKKVKREKLKRTGRTSVEYVSGDG